MQRKDKKVFNNMTVQRSSSSGVGDKVLKSKHESIVKSS